MNQDAIVAVTIPCMFSWFAWMIFSTIRRYKIARLQADVQSKLLEKVGSGQDLLAYAQTDAGRQLLESLQVEKEVSHTPFNRIIGALQTSIIMISLGVALLFLRGRISGAHEGFLMFGTLSTVLGIGFAVSAAVSYYLSKSFGLINGGRA